MDTTVPPAPTVEQILTNEALNRAHARMLAQWGEEAPDTRDEYRHPDDFAHPLDRYED